MKKASHILILVLFVCCLLCLFACAKEDKDFSAQVESSPLNEEEIVLFVKDYMRQNYGDEVEVSVVKKSDLKHSTDSFVMDGTALFTTKYVKVKGGHTYKLKITNKEYGISVEGTYTDGFSLKDLRTGIAHNVDREISIDYTYQNLIDEVDIVKDFEAILNAYVPKYRFYKDAANDRHECADYNIYIYTTDLDRVNEAFQELVKLSYEKYSNIVYSFRAFVFTDEQFYDSFDFDACNNVKILQSDPGDSNGKNADGITASDLHYHPEKLIELYLHCQVTAITTYSDAFVAPSAEEAKPFDHVIYLFTGDPQMYKNSLQDHDKEMRYGYVHTYGIDL